MKSRFNEDVRRLLGTALQKPIGEGNVARSSEPAWDSLKHLEFIFLLEEYFGVRLSEDEISGLTDLDGTIQLLEERIAS